MTVRILVAVLTYRRPRMLARALDALQRLHPPPDADVRFVVVDNDPDASARPLVGPRFAYLVEPVPGIPAARNRALDHAAAERADVLCFVDDDAFPEPDWLCALDACRRASGAVLVVGPVRFAAPPGLKGAWRRFIAASIVARGRHLERHSAARARHGGIVTSGTGNWMGDLRWIIGAGVRFDAERFPHGGEDSAFREAVLARGGRVSFCAEAVVHEELALERTTVRYQFARARAHGAHTARLGRRPRLVLLRHPFGRIAAGAALMVVPVFGIASFALGLHQVGMGVGMLDARRSRVTDLYGR